MTKKTLFIRSLLKERIKIEDPVNVTFSQTLAPEALRFVAELSRIFEDRRGALLSARAERQSAWDQGQMPDFLKETRHIRDAEWRVAPIPPDLLDRRVQITGPVDRKTMIDALNSGAKVYLADFEDSHSPTWEETVLGQVNLRDAVDRTIRYTNAQGKEIRLHENVATLMVRPRGLHLVEKHMRVDGKPISAFLFDFGMFLFHNADKLIANGTGPYFTFPKLESHLEARFWNDVLNTAQDMLWIPRGTIRACVLIETLPAAFEMDEILYELRDHSAGLTSGRWNYIFSFIKKFRSRSDFVLPDRSLVTMDRPFLDACNRLLIQTCHRRGIHALGGMASEVPIQDDPAANAAVLGRVRRDKLREVRLGHDGTRVAHPGLVPVAQEVFDQHMKTPHQIDLQRHGAPVLARELLAVPEGRITEDGLRTNIRVGIQYLESWLSGRGCVPLCNLMETAATAEISRTQVWQWIRHRASLSGKRTVTVRRVKRMIDEELTKICRSVGEDRFGSGKFAAAARLFEAMITTSRCPEFITSIAYEQL